MLANTFYDDYYGHCCVVILFTASIGSAGSAGIPALGLKDLDSSNSSIASSNDDNFHHHAGKYKTMTRH